MEIAGGNQQFFFKKAYEISYALFRLSGGVKPALGEYLERYALALLDSASRDDYGKAASTLCSIVYLARFGGDIGEISNKNVGLVVEEAESLNAAIAELSKSAKPANIDLEDIFSSKSGNGQTPSTFNSPSPAIVLPDKRYEILTKSQALPDSLRKAAMVGSQSGKTNELGGDLDSGNGKASAGCEQKQSDGDDGQGEISAEMRQSAILERMRQIGNCRLRDLQELLSDVSERTIRYDLQNLINRGFVERVGSGGPATYYRVKNQPQESNF